MRNKNTILSILWVVSLVTVVVCMCIVENAVESVPVIPCIVAALALAYNLLFYFINVG